MRDLDGIIEAVRPELEVVEQARRELVARRRRAWKRIAVTAAVIAGAGLLVALVAGGRAGFLIAAVVVAAVVAAILAYTQILVPTRKFKSEFKVAAIGAIVRAMEPGMTFHPDRGVPRDQFVNSRLFATRPDRYRCEDGLQGKIGATSVLLSEVHAEERKRRRDRKGHTQTYYVTIFDGIFMVADFHKHFRGTTRVLPDTAERLLGGFGRLLQDFRPFSNEDLVYLEDPEFEGQFVVYGSDQIETRYILSTAMLRRIVELKAKWKSEVRLSFLDSNVFLAITHKDDLLEPAVGRSALSRELLGQIVSELSVCFDLVEDLNLNTRIWSKA